MFKLKNKLEQEYTGDIAGLSDGVNGEFLFDESVIEKSNKEVIVDENIEIKGLFWQDSVLPRIPYLNTESWFQIQMRTIFGVDINMEAVENLRQDLINESIFKPIYKVAKMAEGEYGYYENNTITLNKKLVENAVERPTQRWILLLVMIEEFGHHLDFLLRNEYTSIGGDAHGDEGKFFTASFIEYNNLLNSDIEFANLTHLQLGYKDVKLKITKSEVLLSHKTEIYRASNNNRGIDGGELRLADGKWVYVEFFKIQGKGAIHEDITRSAAKITNTHWDDALNYGVVWPDVPPNDGETSTAIEDYYTGLRHMNDKKLNLLVYKSHNGKYQYWHSMSPNTKDKKYTNDQIRKLIIAWARGLWEQANEFRGQATDSSRIHPLNNNVRDHGVFFVGKLLHTVQDSYSHSHVVRVTHDTPDIKYKVKTGDTLESIAKKYKLNWEDITIYNWKTSNNDEVNKKLKIKVGCTKKINGNYIFESTNKPGILVIPMPKKNQIISFQSYTTQDEHRHGSADNAGSVWSNFEFIPGALDARDASVKILELYRDRQSFLELEKYLKNHVYLFAPGTANKISAENNKCFDKSVSKEIINDRSCNFPQQYKDLKKEFERKKKLEANN